MPPSTPRFANHRPRMPADDPMAAKLNGIGLISGRSFESGGVVNDQLRKGETCPCDFLELSRFAVEFRAVLHGLDTVT